MSERNELERRFRESNESELGRSLYPGVRSRIAERRGAITTPFRLAGGLAMAAGVMLGVFLAESANPAVSGAGSLDDETAALLTYGEDESLDTVFLNSFTDEYLQ